MTKSSKSPSGYLSGSLPSHPGIYVYKGTVVEVEDMDVALVYNGYHYVEGTSGKDWSAYVPNFDRYRNVADLSAEELVEIIAGNPDYSACVMYWPHPDGGWMAGYVITDMYGACVGHLLGTPYMKQDRKAEWNLYYGFKNGVNSHGSSPRKALLDLVEILLQEKGR